MLRLRFGCLVVLSAMLFCGLSVGCGDGGGDEVDDGGPDVWTDPLTGLTWQVEPSSGYVDWADAKAHCAALHLAGFDDWYLPTISELRTLLRGCPGSGSGGWCGVTDQCPDTACSNDACYECDHGDGPNNGCFGAAELRGGCDYYWSATVVEGLDGRAWAVGFSGGFVFKPRQAYSYHGRCAR